MTCKKSIKLSFTALDLGLREADAVVPVWNDLQDWDLVKEQVLEKNLFQKNSQTSSTRIFRELKQRLETLHPETLQEYPHSSPQDRSIIMLIACSSCYPFISEFINTTISDKILVFDYSLTHIDFKTFWDRMELSYPEMEEMAESTRKKIRQILWRILSEASLLSSTKDPKITPIIPSSTVLRVVKRENFQIHPAFMN